MPLSQAECPGKINVAGWAFSKAEPITQVEVWMDNQPLGKVEYGISRPDVLMVRPWQHIKNCGFGAELVLDMAQTSIGIHQLNVKIKDAKGRNLVFDRPVKIVTPSPASNIAFTPTERYQRWIVLNEPNPKQLERQRTKAIKFTYQPLVSIITPIYNPPLNVLKSTITSVQRQTYNNWELCLCDASLTNLELRDMLIEIAAEDPRIKLKLLDQNLGIAENSNQAIAMASGEFIALLDHDDELSPEALYQNVALLNKYPTADMIYSDEDKIDEADQRFDPFFKPEWSPELFRSMMYTCHLGFYRASLLKEIGAFKAGFEGAQDYDMVLRLVEHTEQIYHIPLILYHWRTLPGSTAAQMDAKDYARQSQIKAVLEHCLRTGLSEKVEPGLTGNTLRVHYKLDKLPSLNIIIAAQGPAEALRRTIESITRRSSYPDYNIILVKDNKADQALLAYFNKLSQQANIEIVDSPNQSNFASILNFGASRAKGDLLLFLNEAIEVITPEWLEAMVEQATRQDIGAVGARLLHPDGTLRHAGIILNTSNIAEYAHQNFPASDPGYASRAVAIQNFSAVSADCLMLKTALFTKLGGFDEKNLPNAFSEIDLCLRIGECKLRIAWTPHAELYYYKPSSQDATEMTVKEICFQSETRYMLQRWSGVLQNDPYYNLNLNHNPADFSIDITSPVPQS